MLKGAIYARYSSDNQREESIDAQVFEIKEYARANNIAIIKVYTDEARSATTDNRPGFLAMIADAKKRLFDAIIIHKLDRFARNRYDSAVYKRELKNAGVKLISVTEKLDGSPESVILESLLEGMAEYYSKNLAREAMKGLNENARNCKHNGGLPPLGLDVDPFTKQYIPSAKQKEIDAVRLIFTMFHDGKGYTHIIEECNLRGYTTKLGNPFAKNSLHAILRNEKYIGTYVYNRSASKDSSGKRNNHQNKSDDDITKTTDAFPGIIDKELFLTVQEKMDENKRQTARYKAKANYLLTGFIFCAECGAALVGNSSSYKTKEGTTKKYYYDCNKKNRQRDCNNPQTKKDLVENMVLEKMYQEIFNEDQLSVICKKINEYNQSQSKEVNEELRYYKNELSETDKQLDNLVTAIASGAPYELFNERIKDLQNKKANLETRILEVDILSRRELITEEMIKNYLDQHRQAVEEKDIDACKKFIHNYVEKVIVDKDNITIHLHFKYCGYVGGGGGS